MPKRMYRERAQPEHRKHFGLLEKKKDWSKRSKYYKQKRNQLNILKRKAELKNEEEFYFRMQNAEQHQGTVHLKETDPHAVSYKKSKKDYKSKLYREMFEEDEYVQEPIRHRQKNKDLETIVKTKNQGVVRLKKMQIKKKIDRIKSEMQFIGQTDDMRQTWDIAVDESQFQKMVNDKQGGGRDGDMYAHSTLKKTKVLI
jgi:hypothetical protein